MMRYGTLEGLYDHPKTKRPCFLNGFVYGGEDYEVGGEENGENTEQNAKGNRAEPCRIQKIFLSIHSYSPKGLFQLYIIPFNASLTAISPPTTTIVL